MWPKIRGRRKSSWAAAGGSGAGSEARLLGSFCSEHLPLAIEKFPLLFAVAPTVPAMLAAIDIFARLLCTVSPEVDTVTALLVLRVEAPEGVPVLEVHDAFAVGLAILPLTLKDATIEEERAMTVATAARPLTCVDGAVLGAHHAIALSLAYGISKTHVHPTAPVARRGPNAKEASHIGGLANLLGNLCPRQKLLWPNGWRGSVRARAQMCSAGCTPAAGCSRGSHCPIELLTIDDAVMVEIHGVEEVVAARCSRMWPPAH